MQIAEIEEITSIEKPKQEKHFSPFLLIFVCIAITCAYYALTDKDEQTYLAELIARRESGEQLPKGEMHDYCHLLYVLKDSIPLECVCVLDGINWDKPPQNPEKLSGDWEEVSTSEQKERTTTRTFKHRLYKFRINFDTRGKAHWHRFNPNSVKKSDFYLDKDCKPILKGSKESHIFVR